MPYCITLQYACRAPILLLHGLDGLDLRDLPLNRGLNTVFEGHSRKRATTASAGQAHFDDTILEGDELDIATVGLQVGANGRQDLLNLFFHAICLLDAA